MNERVSHDLMPVTPTYDELERALLRMRTLVEDAVTIARNPEYSPGDALSVLPDSSEARIRASARRLASTARHAILLSLPSRGAHASDSSPELMALTPLLEVLPQLRVTGVQVRVLAGPNVLEIPVVRHRLGLGRPVRDDSLDARISTARLQAALVVDRKMALLCADFGRERREALIVRSSAVLWNLDTLFLCAWSRATPAAYYRRVFDQSRTEITRQVLRCLVSGVTDEVAARCMGLSVRTYRRHVATLLQELGAESRFQAGARAAELGLVEPASGGTATAVRSREGTDALR